MNQRIFKVLHVEDNPVDIRFFEEIAKEVKDIKLNIHTATTLSQAKDFLGSHTFDLIVSDLGLPDSMGLYTVKQIISDYPGMPIIVMTSINDEQLGVKAIRLGAQDYLPKGNFDSGLLARAIKYSVERNIYVSGISSLDRAKYSALLNSIKTGVAFFDKELILRECNREFQIFFEQALPGVSLEAIADKSIVSYAKSVLSGNDGLSEYKCENTGHPGYSGLLTFVQVMAGDAPHGVFCLTDSNVKAKPIIDLYAA